MGLADGLSVLLLAPVVAVLAEVAHHLTVEQEQGAACTNARRTGDQMDCISLLLSSSFLFFILCRHAGRGEGADGNFPCIVIMMHQPPSLVKFPPPSAVIRMQRKLPSATSLE